jgi:hypothetical protein
MNRPTASFLILWVVLVWASTARAYIAASPTCDNLLRDSDVVLKGEPLSGKEIGPADPSKGTMETTAARRRMRLFRGRVRVDQVFKGDLADAEIDVSFFGPGSVDLPLHREVLLFLKKSNDGFRVADLEGGEVLVPPGRAKSTDLEAELVSGAKNQDHDTSLSSTRCLVQIAGPDRLRQLIASPDLKKNIGVRATLIAEAAKGGDAAATAELATLLNSPEMQTAGSYLRGQNEARSACLHAISALERKRDPKLAPIFASLVTHKDKGIRRAAAYALRASKTKDTLPALAKLLDDPDSKVQYAAVIALCETAHPDMKGCPTLKDFKSNLKRHKSDWQQWWEQNKSKYQ